MTDWWVGVWIDGWMDGWLAYRRGYFKPIWTFDSIFININLKNRITTIDQALSNQNFLIYYNFLILFNVIQIDGFLFYFTELLLWQSPVLVYILQQMSDSTISLALQAFANDTNGKRCLCFLSALFLHRSNVPS